MVEGIATKVQKSVDNPTVRCDRLVAKAKVTGKPMISLFQVRPQAFQPPAMKETTIYVSAD